MLKIIFAAGVLLLACTTASAYDGAGRDGDWWTSHTTRHEKLVWVSGFLDGQTFAHMEVDTIFGTGPQNSKASAIKAEIHDQFPTATNGWTYQGDFSHHRIFMLGWNAGPGGVDPYLNGAKGSYIWRNGNYDYLDDSIVDWVSTSPHTLPGSFNLSAAPSFFSAGTACKYSWPWVTPTGSTPIQANSCGGSGLPAKARYEAGTPLKQP